MVLIATEVLEALHLGTQALASTHVVKVAVAVLGVITTTDVITEVRIVKTRGTGEPLDDLGDFRVRPLSALSCPPAERHAPAIEMLAHQLRINHIGERISGRCGVDLRTEIPQMLQVRAVLIGIDLLVSVVAVGTQVSVIRLAAQLHELAHTLLDGKLRLIH